MGERVGYQMVDHVTGMNSFLIRKHWYVGEEPKELEYFIKRIKKALDKHYDLNEALLAGCKCTGDEVSWLEFDHYFEHDMGDHGVYQIDIVSETEWHLNHYECETDYIQEPYTFLGWFRGGLCRFAEVDWSGGEPEFYWHFTEDDDPYLSGYFTTYRGPGIKHREEYGILEASVYKYNDEHGRVRYRVHMGDENGKDSIFDYTEKQFLAVQEAFADPEEC